MNLFRYKYLVIWFLIRLRKNPIPIKSGRLESKNKIRLFSLPPSPRLRWTGRRISALKIKKKLLIIGRIRGLLCLGASIFIGTILYSILSIYRYLNYQSLAFDLGIYDQMIWLASRFKPLFSSLLDCHFFGDHLTPILLLLTPLYWLWNNVIILLIFQSFFVCLGALPVFLLAEKKIKNNILSLTISFCYLFFYGIQNALIYDFHPIVLATGLLAWVFWFYESKKWILFWTILIIILGLQENFSLLIFAYGIYLVINNKDYRKGIVISILGLSWFLLAIFIIIPYFKGNTYTYLPSHLHNLNFLSIFKLIYYPYSKISVIFISFMAFGFLPLLSPVIFIFLIEEFIQRFIGSPIATRWVLEYQYNSILAPVLALGTINFISRLSKDKRKFLPYLLILSLLVIQIIINPGLNKLLDKNFIKLDKAKQLNSLVSLIPNNASVAATNNLASHLAHREKIILLTDCRKDKTLWQNETKRCFNLMPEYIMVDLNKDNSVANYFPDYSREKLLDYINYLISFENYKILGNNNEVFLIKRED